MDGQDETRPLMKYNAAPEDIKFKDNKTLEDWRNTAIELYKLLDDIDTAGDMFRPKIDGYFKYVQGKSEGRHSLINPKKLP